MFIAWGPERTMLYNDGYAPMCTNRHPWALGRPFSDVWSDIIDNVGPIMDAAYASIPTYMDDIEFHMVRHGRKVETRFSFGYTPVHDETDRVAGIFCTALEITNEVLAARSRTEELLRLRDLLEKAPSFMAVLAGPDHRFEITNAAYLQLIGHRDVIGKSAREGLPELEGQGFYHPDKVYRTGEAFVGRGLEINLQHAPGAPIQKGFLNFIYQPMRDAADQITGIFVEGTDVTDQKNAELGLREAAQRQDVLSAELHHRIKNSLAMVGAIATQTLKGDDIADRRAAFSARLSALSNAHDILTSRTWSSAPIRTIIEGALSPHWNGTDRSSIDGPDLELNAKQALSLGLAIHELATNAAKYGALSTPPGRIDICWGFEAGEFFLSWEEAGGPMILDAPRRTGFGSRLITRVLAADFGGKVSIDYLPQGVKCSLKAPAGSVSAEADKLLQAH